MSKQEQKSSFDIRAYPASVGATCESCVYDHNNRKQPCGRKAEFLVCFSVLATDGDTYIEDPTHTLEVHLCTLHVVKTGIYIMEIAEY